MINKLQKCSDNWKVDVNANIMKQDSRYLKYSTIFRIILYGMSERKTSFMGRFKKSIYNKEQKMSLSNALLSWF